MPPAPVKVRVASFEPKQVSGVLAEVNVTAGGLMRVAVLGVAIQVFESFTTMANVPAARPERTALVL